MAAALGELGMKDRDELYEKIGLGERLAPLVARRLLPPAQRRETEGDGGGRPAPLAVAGTEGLLVTYARCCFPIPDDPIIAFLSAGRGIVVHRETCANVEDYRKHPENWMSVTWEATEPHVRLGAAHRGRRTAWVCSRPSPRRSPRTETNIDHVSVEERDAQTSMLVFEVKVRDRLHLAKHRARDPAHARCAGVVRTIATSHARVASGAERGHVQARSSTPTPPRRRSAPYSQAVRAGDTVYISGQIPLDPATAAGRGRHRRADPPRVRQPEGDRGRGRRLARTTRSRSRCS
jgi:enamine deaminase RidA (YjgF/YER057c/UK114 family)